MSRSGKKKPWVDPTLIKKVMRARADGSMAVSKTWSRDSEISPDMVGVVIGVHNGKQFIPVSVKEDMVGHRLGEFALTRKFTKHGGKMQRDIEKGAETPAAAPAKK